jgi:snRNA-activating protein complex (SNAPc), subunit 3
MSKLLTQIGTLPIEKRPSIRKAETSTHRTRFASLALRLHEPYWLLHNGNCEHFLVVDQIRSVSDIHGAFYHLQISPRTLSLTDSNTPQIPSQATRSLSKSRPLSSIFAVRARKSLPFGPLLGTSGSVRARAYCVLGAGGTWASSAKMTVLW